MMPAALHVPAEPEWDQIGTIWDPCDRFLGANGLDGDDRYALCMVVRELVENAVKYGHYEGGGPPIDVDLTVAPGEVTIQVRNPLGVDSLHLREFDRAIQWIRGYQDPFEAYVEKLRRVSSAPSEPGKSGLGLTRIAYEGRCLLDFYVDDSNTLAVSAVRCR
jgi:hypothetical protein